MAGVVLRRARGKSEKKASIAPSRLRVNMRLVRSWRQLLHLRRGGFGGGEGFAFEVEVTVDLGGEFGALGDGGVFARTELRKGGVGRIGVGAEGFVIAAHRGGFVVGEANRSDDEGNFAVVAEMFFGFDFGGVARGFGTFGDNHNAVE